MAFSSVRGLFRMLQVSKHVADASVPGGNMWDVLRGLTLRRDCTLARRPAKQRSAVQATHRTVSCGFFG